MTEEDLKIFHKMWMAEMKKYAETKRIEDEMKAEFDEAWRRYEDRHEF